MDTKTVLHGYVITNINNKVKWTCLTEHGGTTKQTQNLMNFGMLNTMEFGQDVWSVISQIHYIEVCYIKGVITENFQYYGSAL